jgi:hypothetical protein
MSRVRSALIAAGAVVLLVPAAAAAEAPPERAPSSSAPAPPPAAAADPTPASEGEAQPAPEHQQRASKLKLRLHRIKRGKLKVGGKFTAAGTLRPFVRGERVTLLLRRGKKTIRRKRMRVRERRHAGLTYGRFKISDKLVRPGRYTVRAIHHPSARLARARDRTRPFRIRYPDLDPGNHRDTVKVFNRLLARQGYVNDRGRAYDSATERAVLAFRKVNKMDRTTNATPKIFKRLAKGKGGYKVRHPGSGRHVEADLSRQIMVLAKGRKAKEIYHISTGAPATPTYPGTWRFYSKTPGYNSLGMYYSVYYNRGFAIHGYHSVPTYPASHGCLRNPIPNAKHIYNWVDVGMLIHIDR